MAKVDSFNLLFNEMSKSAKRLEELLALIGLLYIGKQAITLTYHLINGCRIHFFSKLWPQNLSLYGEWAVITGGSDGIGKAFAYALAKRNVNLLLIARQEEKLINVASDLVTKFGVKVEILSADFVERLQTYKKIDDKLVNKEIGILINNVAALPLTLSLFHRISRNEHLGVLDVNLASMLVMTSKILPSMVERRKGLIINVSSTAGLFPIPFMATYSSSKAYMDFFSRALNYEYRNYGVTVQSLVPNHVPKDSSVGDYRKRILNFFKPHTMTFAENALSTVGYTPQTSGYWMHDMVNWFSQSIPDCIRIRLAAYFVRKHFSESEID
ncbi:inactive hydroxysteroid dehydrogenase-like protein 1 [Leptotrombidium deliense]|uniref:Inactive hydroxysteroid dehydrogenase-like protein 1 n=1 Tax=Leptotrombidium deliense TaxID=299467 RepID=A0A443SC83_9ACAR|nr:inactive hydroxysteroid dehydrogenase-like protein 1 [Leptotrombidium deliense]